MARSNVVPLRPEAARPDVLLSIEQARDVLERMGAVYSIHAVRRMAAKGHAKKGGLPFFRGPDGHQLKIWKTDLLKAMRRPDWVDPADAPHLATSLAEGAAGS